MMSHIHDFVVAQVRVPLAKAVNFEFGDAIFGMAFPAFANTTKMCAGAYLLCYHSWNPIC